MERLVDINSFVSAIEASSGELHHDIWIYYINNALQSTCMVPPVGFEPTSCDDSAFQRIPLKCFVDYEFFPQYVSVCE